MVELGIDTFGDISLAADGTLKRPDQVLRDVVEEAVVADQVGIDFIGLGEHHRPDFAISAPEIVLAAIAGRTQRPGVSLDQMLVGLFRLAERHFLAYLAPQKA